MGKPTEAELSNAIAEATRMRENGDDPHFVAKSLLNLRYRCKYLEKVLQSAERYLHSGQGTREHSQLVRAINEYNAANSRSAGTDQEGGGMY